MTQEFNFGEIEEMEEERVGKIKVQYDSKDCTKIHETKSCSKHI